MRRQLPVTCHGLERARERGWGNVKARKSRGRYGPLTLRVDRVSQLGLQRACFEGTEVFKRVRVNLLCAQ